MDDEGWMLSRHLLEDQPLITCVVVLRCFLVKIFSVIIRCVMGFLLCCSDEMVSGYMSNSELEMAIKEFGRRCSNISRVYRYII